MTFILEVQKINVVGHIDYPKWNGKCEHIGYINKVFNTKEDARDYYDKFNPHMRPLNAIENWCSDWDPRTCLMYIVRERFCEYLKIPPFEENKK